MAGGVVFVDQGKQKDRIRAKWQQRALNAERRKKLKEDRNAKKAAKNISRTVLNQIRQKAEGGRIIRKGLVR